MIIKQDFLYSPAGENRRLHIHLPNDYFDTDEHYPVMYFFDGHNLYSDWDATYGKSWGMERYLNAWDKPMIIVGMECGHAEGQRISEYLPYRPFRNYFRAIQPMGGATLEWIVNEVKPFIDHQYRTMPFRECTGIGGSSMGGLMAIYGLVRYNRWFSKGACVSSAIGVCQPTLMNDMTDSEISPDTRAFLSWGTKEARGIKNAEIKDSRSYTYRSNKAVANKFIAKGAIPMLYCQIGGSHCEADWEKQVPIFMDFLWKG